VSALMSVLLPAFMTPNTPMFTRGTSLPATGDGAFRAPASGPPPPPLLLLAAGCACWRPLGLEWKGREPRGPARVLRPRAMEPP
jgi:hypothetical protein